MFNYKQKNILSAQTGKCKTLCENAALKLFIHRVMGHCRPLFISVFSMQWTDNALLTAGFEPGPSGVGSDCSANSVTTTTIVSLLLCSLRCRRLFFRELFQPLCLCVIIVCGSPSLILTGNKFRESASNARKWRRSSSPQPFFAFFIQIYSSCQFSHTRALSQFKRCFPFKSFWKRKAGGENRN